MVLDAIVLHGSFPIQVCHAIFDRSWTPNTSVSDILACVYGVCRTGAVSTRRRTCLIEDVVKLRVKGKGSIPLPTEHWAQSKVTMCSAREHSAGGKLLWSTCVPLSRTPRVTNQQSRRFPVPFFFVFLANRASAVSGPRRPAGFHPGASNVRLEWCVRSRHHRARQGARQVRDVVPPIIACLFSAAVLCQGQQRDEMTDRPTHRR